MSASECVETNGACGAGGAETVRDEALDEVIASLHVLREPPVAQLQRLCDLAVVVSGAEKAAVNFLDNDFQHQVIAHGIAPSVCDRGDSMCAVTVTLDEPVVLSDARDDDRWADNPFVTGQIDNVRFYASFQLRMYDDVVVGTLCVFDDEVRELSPQQVKAMRTLADQVVEVLELRRRSYQLQDTMVELQHTLRQLQLALAQRDAALDEAARVHDELERSNDELSWFAGQVSHDLRNPLTAVTGFYETLADLPPIAGDPLLSRLVHAGLAASGRMAQLLEELLTYARVGGTLHLAPTDLTAVAHDVVDDLSSLVAETGAQLQVRHLPTVDGDAVQLRALLQNLVANALKYRSPDRAPVVEITAEAEGVGWVIRVSDNGLGIPADQRAKVLEPFARVRRDDGVEGSGLGLATCRRIAAAHGGEIRIADSPLGGASVGFTLPSAALSL